MFELPIKNSGVVKRKNLKPIHNLKAVFKAIRNHLASNAVGATRDEVLAQQLINLIFCKIYDERCTAQDEMVTFSAGTGKNPEDVKNRISALFEKVKSKYKEVFDVNDSINLDDKSVAYVVGELQNYCLMEAERDSIADAFEVFIGHALKGGQGQFFTPRNVVKMMIDILDPGDEDTIIDPACGSGGFLIEALKYLLQKPGGSGIPGVSDPEPGGKGEGIPPRNKSPFKTKKKEFTLGKIRGIEKDYFLAKLARAYMALVGDGTGTVFCEDCLENPVKWGDKTKTKIKMGEFSVLLTNPPFGSKIFVSGKEKLKQYDLGYKWKFDKKTQTWIKTQKVKEREEPQVIFIERCLALLKDGGKMAMVLPSGILGNEKEEYLRNYITQKGNLFAIVELPFETFSPHIAINTSVLFIQKGKKNGARDIFISINEYCGHDKKGRPVGKDDIPMVSRFYRSKKSNNKNFFIKQEMLESNFVAKRYLHKYIDNLSLIRKGLYKIITLGSIIKSVHNGANIDDASIYVDKENGIPYILVKSITKEGINFENLKYIRKCLLTRKEVVKNKVTEDTIVMTRAGNSGISANIPPDLVNGIASGFLIYIHVDLKKVNQYYLVAYLNSKYGQLQLERISSGSILQSIRLSDLKMVEIILPPVEIQNQIGNKIKESVYALAGVRTKIKKAMDGINGLVKKNL